MTNFLEETLLAIKDSGHTVEDINFIGSVDGEYSVGWEKFRELANVDYSSGYGAAYVATDLIVQFTDGSYMTRGEYDGSEWWEYLRILPMYSGGKELTRLVGNPKKELWPTIHRLVTGERK